MCQSGYNKKLTYKPTETNHEKHSKHTRNTMWFNSPFRKNYSTKIGKNISSLLDLHFPKNHIYNSIFNRKKVKVSYSCMGNIKSITNNHNMKNLNDTAEIEESCISRNKNNYNLDGKCLIPNIIYEAQITSISSKTGLTNYQNDSTLNSMKTTRTIKRILDNKTQPFHSKSHL